MGREWSGFKELVNVFRSTILSTQPVVDERSVIDEWDAMSGQPHLEFKRACLQ
jgi:hypothetical protein